MTYNSTPETKNLDFADHSYQLFRKYLHRYKYALGSPARGPRNHEIEFVYNPANVRDALGRPIKGSHTFVRERADGSEYTYYLRQLMPWVFKKAIERRDKFYYQGSGSVVCMAMLDTDAHHGQGPEDIAKVKNILDHLFPEQIATVPSDRGLNGYMWVQRVVADDKGKILVCCSVREYIEWMERLQTGLQKWLWAKTECDFEIKGLPFVVERPGDGAWKVEGKQFGKLPIHRPEWNYSKLEEFRRVEQNPVPITTIIELVQRLEENERNMAKRPLVRNSAGYYRVPDELERQLYVKGGKTWFNKFDWYLDGRRYWIKKKVKPQPSMVTDGSSEMRPILPPTLEQPATRPRFISKKSSPDINEIRSEPDAFVRQTKAVMIQARMIKAVPTTLQALHFIQEHRLYSGEWENNLAARTRRVEEICKFVGRSFDATKCKGKSIDSSRLSFWQEWALKKMPDGIAGVSRDYLASTMLIVEFCLVTDPNKDNSLPHRRAEALHKCLYEAGVVPLQFNPNYWAIVREGLHDRQIVSVYDRRYCAGRAMRWVVGKLFPAVNKAIATIGLSVWKNCLEILRRGEERKNKHNTCFDPIDQIDIDPQEFGRIVGHPWPGWTKGA